MDEYISREAIIKELKKEIKACDMKFVEDGWIKKGLKIALKDIKAVKPQTVQLVKHGRWLPSDSCITAAYGTIHCQICSECGADLMEDSDYDYDFCPVCGARMDLKDGDAE